MQESVDREVNPLVRAQRLSCPCMSKGSNVLTASAGCAGSYWREEVGLDAVA